MVSTWLGHILRDPTVGAGIVAVLAALLGLDAPKWDARVARRQAEHDALARLTKQFYPHRPTGPRLYGFAPVLALRTNPGNRQVRLNARARIAWDLSAGQRCAGTTLARDWLATVGALALALRREHWPLRRFLQTYHLSVIREALVAMPFVAVLWAEGGLSRLEKNQAVAGVALMELAAFYNSLARQQREPVYFKGSADTPPLGPIVRAPGPGRRVVCTVLDRVLRSLRLTSRRMAGARRRLERIAASLPGSASAPTLPTI